MTPLPVDAHLDPILDAVRQSRALVVTAAPGAGKTTRIPPHLAADGPLILLQPRRVAARAIAARIASERGWTIGREVGWQVRFDRAFSADTRLLVVTEGILTVRLQRDPLLSDFVTIVVDEFHERSIHADLALALARQAWRARADLRIVVMSATLDAAPVRDFLGGCPLVDVPGRLHPLDIGYAPGAAMVDVVPEVLGVSGGDVLCFLPGAYEIERTRSDLERRLGGAADVVPLHGSLDAQSQDLVLRPGPRRRAVVATNIAETSVTVPGVTAVVDSGMHKVARYDADRGVDSLEVERISSDSADQRAGRAGRIAPGIVRRLWDSRDRLRPHREAEIRRVDLSSPLLDVIAWGGNPQTFEWFETPDASRIDAALRLLERLELIGPGGSGRSGGSGGSGGSRGSGGWKLTEIGEQVHRLPLHPRLGRMLVAAGGARDIVRACAVLSERHVLPPRKASTTSDLLSALDEWTSMPAHVRRNAARISDFRVQISDLFCDVKSQTQSEICTLNSEMPEREFRRALLTGYPDRVAQRRSPRSPNVLLASGTGATIARESGVHEGEFLVALDLHSGAGTRQPSRTAEPAVALIRIASVVDREWLEPTSSEVVHLFEKQTGTVIARRVDRYDALTLGEHPVEPSRDIATQLLADGWIAREPDAEDERLLRRIRFLKLQVNVKELIREAARGARKLDDIRLSRALPAAVVRTLDRDAPEKLIVPSGRAVRLTYNEDGTVGAAVKLQELFGLTDTPRVGPRREPVVLSLLAPNGRPVQVTTDLKSFWERTYPEVRKELRGRYPKHRWPEDPWKRST